MQSTRQRIMVYLAENHRTSAHELSRLLDMTVANIRHHLGKLEREGKIEVVGQTEPEGKGRPVHIYMATRAAQANGFENLVRAMLDEIRTRRTQQQKETRLAFIADTLRAETGDEGGPITLRLGKAAQRLNELRYEAHWEAHASGAQIILGNCPYAAIIDEYPELCQMDHLLIKKMLGSDITLAEKFTRDPQGSMVCRFRLD